MPKKQLDDMLLIVRIVMLLLGTVNIQPTDLPYDFEDCGVLYLLVSKYIIPGSKSFPQYHGIVGLSDLMPHIANYMRRFT